MTRYVSIQFYIRNDSVKLSSIRVKCKSSYYDSPVNRESMTCISCSDRPARPPCNFASVFYIYAQDKSILCIRFIVHLICIDFSAPLSVLPFRPRFFSKYYDLTSCGTDRILKGIRRVELHTVLEKIKFSIIRIVFL